jgi:radical SAM-linked protein
LRFVSHAETLKIFQRACVRAGIPLQYSEGFNPRPKLSLVLPRPVGVESDEELLCFRVNRDSSLITGTADEHRIQTELAAQLPEGCELLSVSIVEAGTSFQPSSATYVFPTRRDVLNERMQSTVDRVLASESLPVQRFRGPPADAKGSPVKNVDVRIFLKSIELDDRSIIVECKISPDGSIRVDEILGLLELDESKLSGPIRRTNVQWHRY